MTAAFALAAVLAAAQAPSSPVAEARRLIEAGEPRKAIAALEGAKDDGDAERRADARLVLGVAYYHADEPAKAVEILSPIADALPAGSTARREAEQVLGLSAFVIGRFAEAIPRLEATRRWAPDNLELAYALAQAYIQTQRPDPARGVLAQIFRVPADSAGAHLVTAQTMIRLELNAAADTELIAALQKDPRLPTANQLRGQIALFRGQLAEAVAHTERELAINPANALALSQLGDAYVRQAKWDEAIGALQRSIWLNPYYSAPYILLGRAYVKKAQPAAAESMLRRAIQYDPNNRSAHYLLAQLLQQAGRGEEAQREFEIAERLRERR